MDSKYSLLSSNRPVLPKFNIKPRPQPVVFNCGPPAKKFKSSENEEKGRQRISVAPKQSLQDQRRSLPIYGVRNRLLEEIKKHQTLIIIGETGSGKTTQIPQYIYSARLQDEGKIAITQPRRVAAVTIASRVAQEIGTQLGEIVGYHVRFEDSTTRRTKIKYMTDGMLLREALADNLLTSYNVIILDEAHERTVHTDVLFGIVKETQKLRIEKQMPPLKIIIMSATMDVDHFSRYFNNCKTVYIEGRTHPVEVYHAVKPQEDYYFACLVTLFKIHREAPPNEDVLIFLTGQEEIETMMHTIYNVSKDPELSKYPSIKVYPLYAALPSEQQLDVFKSTPSNVRKVILSTNIAETSLTIPGIRYVIDSGMVKERTYRASTGLDSLKVQAISQAQAWQRTGRAGRESLGYCYRMYTKSEFQQMRKTTLPEIERCNLASVALQLLALGIHARNFDFMDRPSKYAIEKAFEQLLLLGAIESIHDTKLTALGKKMSYFPLDPQFSKILIMSKEYGCVEEMLSIISVLSGESVLCNPTSKREQALASREKFASPYGDHIFLLNIYRAFSNAAQKKQWCYENFLNYRNLSYAREVRTQLAEICEKCDITPSSCGSNMDQVRKCLITGLIMNVAELRNKYDDGYYMTLDSEQRALIHPQSVLHGSKPHCVLFTEVVQTSKTYLRSLSTIEPEWIQEIAPEYVRTHRLFTASRNDSQTHSV